MIDRETKAEYNEARQLDREEVAMPSRSTSINALMNEITQGRLVLPDLQREFVWKEDQIRLLLDSILRGYPFGSLLIWNTQFLGVPYVEFFRDFRTGQTRATR